MKTMFKALWALVLVLPALAAQAQTTCPGCVTQTANCPAGTQEVQLCGPASIAATSGDTVSETVTFALPVSFVIRQGDPFPLIPSIPGFPPFTAPFDINVFVDTVFLTSVTGLPAGLSWESDSAANGNFYLSYVYQYGCVNFCGNVDCGLSGTYTATLNFDFKTVFTTSDPQFQALINQFAGSGTPTSGSIDVTFNIDPSTNLVLDLTTSGPSAVIDSGETITLNATTGFDSYLWSTGDATPSVNLTPTATTVYTVTATDAFGCQQTDNLEVEVLAVEDSIPDDTTGIANIGYNDARLQIYPNPAKGSFQIVLVQLSNDSYAEVMDITGKRVWSQPLQSLNNSITLDAPKGLYIVKVVSGNTIMTRKLLIH